VTVQDEVLLGEVLERLLDSARDADHTAQEFVTIRTEDLIDALRELDALGVLVLDLD
jgi:hypothetical protein